MTDEQYVKVPVSWLERLHELSVNARNEADAWDVVDHNLVTYDTNFLIGYANSAGTLAKHGERVKNE